MDTQPADSAAWAAASGFAPPPVALDEPGAFWIAEGGEADIFALPADFDGSGGPRLFVGRVAAGGLICGHAPDFESLMARATPGGRLRRLGDLAELGDAVRIQAAMMAWAGVLATALGARLWRPGSIDHVLVPGKPLAAEAQCSASVRGTGLWVLVPQGGAMLLGLEPVSGLVPLPPQGWLVASRVIELRGWNGVAAADLRIAVAGVQAFTDACVAMLPGLRGLAEGDESGRLLQRGRQDAEAAGLTAELAAHLVHGKVRHGPAADPSAEAPLFAAMVAVARAAGLRAKLRRPTRLREQDIDTPPTMDEIARASGILLRPVVLPPGWWRRDFGPLLCRMPGEDMVALVPVHGGYRLLRPGAAATPVTAEIAERLEPRVWTMLEPLPDQPLTVQALGRLVPVPGRDGWLALVSAVLGAALGLGLPFAMSFATKSLIPAGDRQGLLELGIALAAVGCANFVVQMAGDIARHRILASAEAPLHAGLWDRLLRLPLATLRQFDASELNSRVGIAMAVPLGVRSFRIGAVGYAATALAATAAMAAYHAMAALAAVGLMAVLLGIAVAGGLLRAKAHKQAQTQNGQADSLAIEAISGITKLRLAGVEHRILGVWSERFIASRRNKLTEEQIDTWQSAIAAGLGFFGLAALFLVFLSGGGVDNGAVVGFMMAYMVGSGAVIGLGGAFGGFYPLWAMRDMAVPLLQAMPEATVGRLDPGRLSGRIDVTNLAFGYPGAEQPVFAGLNLSIEPGEFVAICGRSGCGKSTLVRLLLGLDQPRFGSITYDRQDLHSLDLGLLRRRIGTVLQGAQLPPGPLLDVIRGFSEATEAQVWKALTDSAIAGDVRAMPLGIRTPIADAARSLSGGQVQRLLLARALVNQPDILILDEATSALDPATQAITTRTLARMTCTRIVIAHRLETIRQADRVLVIERGRVAHAGGFEALQAAGVI